jgi:hypothetical protein
MTGATAFSPMEPATDIVARYERLRSAMLGEALPADARSGLIIFLRHGMWSWARMPAVEPTKSQPASSRFSAPAQVIERRAIICLLAGMAMAIYERRTS